MAEDGTDSLPREIIEYLEELRDVQLPEELQEADTGGAVARLIGSSPELAELMAQVAQEGGESPLPVQPGKYGEIELSGLPDEQAMKAKAAELLGLDIPKPKEPDAAPPEPAADDEEPTPEPEPAEEAPEPAPAAETPAPPDEPEPPPEIPAEDQHADWTAKINEIIAYLRLRHDIETPSAMEGDRD